MRANIRKESRQMADEGRHYKAIGREFASHESVDHGEEEYGRGVVHTNTVEGYYSVFKRGMKGVYQHCHESIYIAILQSLISVIPIASSSA